MRPTHAKAVAGVDLIKAPHRQAMLADLIETLRHELRSQGDGCVPRCENLLGKIAVLNDSACVAGLLPLLDDDAEHDELMFSLIHTIERFDDATYVRAITDHLGACFAASPRWIVVLHMRMLNSPSTSAAYADCIKALPKNERDIVRTILEAVQKRKPTFMASCDALLAVI